MSSSYDVFLSYASPNAAIASDVELELNQAGLSVFNPLKAFNAGNQGKALEELREELGASLAVVAIFGDQLSLSAPLAFELGAALAWNKPIYGIITERALQSRTNLPAAIEIYKASQLPEIVASIQAARKPLSEQQRGFLASIYEQTDLPTDQLARTPAAISSLTTRFNKLAKTRFTGERILRELLVLRKSGMLPRLKKTTQGSWRRQPA